MLRWAWKRGAYIALGGLGAGGLCAANTEVRDAVHTAALGTIRFGRVIFTVSRVVLDYELLEWQSSKSNSEKERKALESKTHYLAANRLLRLAELNGGCFIKVGQYIAALDYLVPPEYIEVLQVLHSRAPQSSFGDVRYVLEKELKCKLEDIFETFDERPLASASLAQVHRAILKREYYDKLKATDDQSNKAEENGEQSELDRRRVAVKVQHRNVRTYAEIDMQAMATLVRCVARMFPRFKFEWLVQETQRNLPVELDFCAEVANAERAKQTFGYLRFLRVPSVYRSISTARCIVMEYLNGVQIDDVRSLNALGVPTYRVVEKLSLLYAEMIFRRGFVHCDPHPGNLFVVPIYSEGKKQRRVVDVQLILLDHGLYQSLSDDFTSLYARTWNALLTGDMSKVRKCAAKMNCDDYFDVLACIISGRSWTAVQQGIMKTQQNKQEQTEIRDEAGKFVTEIIEVLDRVPRELLLLLKTNDLLRGVEQKLYGRPLQGQLARELHSSPTTTTDALPSNAESFVDSVRSTVARWTTRHTDSEDDSELVSIGSRVSEFVADEVQERKQTWYITFLYLSRACLQSIRTYKVSRCKCKFASSWSSVPLVDRAITNVRRFYCVTYWNVKCFVYCFALQVAEFFVRWQYEFGERLYHRVA